jgi:large subunit ribosomal protein L25
MKTVSLSGSLRANVGKTDAAALRLKGHVPCVIYGNGEQIHFSTDTRNFKNIIFTPETNLVNVEVDGKSYRTVLQEAQYHKITDALIHADFLLVSDDKPVTVHLPVRTVGQSEGVKAGGKLTVKLRKVKVRGLIANLPEAIEISIDGLAIGRSVSAGDISIDGITIWHPKNISIVSVVTTRNVTTDEAAPAGGDKKAAAPAKAAPAKK